MRIGDDGSVAARHTASATSVASVTGEGLPHSAKIFCAKSAYASGIVLCIRDCAFSPKRVVGARPGSTRFTRTLNCSSSRASDSVNALTADLLAVYTDSKGLHRDGRCDIDNNARSTLPELWEHRLCQRYRAKSVCLNLR